MDTSSVRRQAMRSPLPSSPDRFAPSKSSQRRDSSGSDTSATSSNLASMPVAKRPAYVPQTQLTSLGAGSRSNTSLSQYSRSQYMPHDGSLRKGSPHGPPNEVHRHRPRQHSQGFFEPSLPSALVQEQPHMSNLTASQIAAQAAMQHQQMASHSRKRSQTTPYPQEQHAQDGKRGSGSGSKSSPPPTQTSHEISHHVPTTSEQQYRNGLVGTSAAATAAASVFPRSVTPVHGSSSTEGNEKETKKASKMKLFKPKHIGISRDKDKEAKEKPLPSPVKISGPSGLSRVVNASTTSLADSSSSNHTMYALNNASSSTMIPASSNERLLIYEREKSHKHTDRIRQKLKLKDKDDHHNLPLSSANSNSRPLDTNNPSSLYSFAPSSPGPNSAFSKSVSGLDLRHAGRALREKKKEDKEKANASTNTLEQVYSRGESDTTEWPPLSSIGTSFTNSSTLTFPLLTPFNNDPALQQTLAGFGLNNMTPDDAWDFLKAKLLAIFEGEDVRIAVEDLNRLVTIYVQRCVQKHAPSIITEDLNDLFQTGFLSLNHTLRMVPDERIVPHLVSMWLFVFGTVLPFMQAVFLPLDLEFKGRGSVLTTPSAAADFWGALPNPETGGKLSSSPVAGTDMNSTAGDELEVRRMLLISFRDKIILPRYDILKATFSRLSLESINAGAVGLNNMGNSSNASDRPSAPHSLDPKFSSYSSQSSTLLGTSSSAGRSRAASNVSNPAQDIAFHSFSSPPAARPSDKTSSQVTETVGRMLQCISVLATVQSGDEAQSKVEELGKELKLNWLGRGRTGRNRRGFVGSRVRAPRSIDGDTVRALDREGSPTPTRMRTGLVSRFEDGIILGGAQRSML